MTAPLLRTEGLTLRYGRFTAVHDVSIELQAGRRYGVLGPNGAGKTSLLHLLTGTHRASAGRIVFDGVDITAHGPEKRRHAGLGRSFQKTSVFSELTVLDNLRLAVQSDQGLRLFNPWSPRAANQHLDARARALLDLLDGGAALACGAEWGRRERRGSGGSRRQGAGAEEAWRERED